MKSFSRAIQQRLDAASEAVFIEGNPQHQAAEDYKKLCRETKIDMRKEYKTHLEMMKQLKVFKGLRTTWDHAFYKAIVMTSGSNKQEAISATE